MEEPTPRLSVIIPAYNEERGIGQAIHSVRKACESVGIDVWEIIVANDGSTDRTAEVAAAHGAAVIPVGVRCIAAARNAGARAAKGRHLIFLDADTELNSRVLGEAMAALEEGAVGGGACIEWDEHVSHFGDLMAGAWNFVSRLFRAPAGSFIFIRREVFEAIGGFDERLFVSEEIHLGWGMHRRGRVVIVPSRIRTSARKVRAYSTWELLAIILRVLISPFGFARRRENCDLWYRRRE